MLQASVAHCPQRLKDWRLRAEPFGGRVNRVQGQTLEQWQNLCEQAAAERDPEKLMKLIQEINRLLEEKEQRLKSQGKAISHSAA